MTARANARRGYALVVVLLVLALVAVAAGTVLSALEASAEATGRALKSRQGFYVCDGMLRTLTRMASTHLQTGNADDQSIVTALCAAGGGGCSWGAEDIVLQADPLPLVRPAGYRVTSLVVTSLAKQGCVNDTDCGAGGVCFGIGATPKVCRRAATLPDGSFAGMQALSDTLRIEVDAENTVVGNTCHAAQDVTVGRIGVTEFYVFSALDYFDWQPSSHTTARGRVHANGDLCLGGPSVAGDRFFLSRVTSSGDVNPMHGPLCRTQSTFGRDDVMIGKSAGANFDANSDGNTSDVVVGDFDDLAPGDRTPTWRDHALTKWGGQLQDRAHNVRPLRLPVLTAPTAQQGALADGSVTANDQLLRFLVDPVLAGDDASVRGQKLAEKADLRIINGVWYFNDGSWPGRPIWSDHPSLFTTSAREGVEPGAKPVGQGTLFGASARPFRYSYYRTDAADALDYTPPVTSRPVVSYGTLLRDGGGAYPLWRPGYRCPDGTIQDATVDAVACGGGARTAESGLLQAARGGFRDGQVELRRDGGFSQRHDSVANVLPLNFDVGALQDALADLGPFELGRVFMDAGRTFNGIVFITSTWTGSMGSPPTETRQGQNDTDGSQPAASAHIQRDLPFALCTSPAHAGAAFVPGPTDLAFVRPSCAGYFGGGSEANTNVVRIINARNIEFANSTEAGVPATGGFPTIAPGTLPRGLTIVSNLPVYLLGDVNLSSNVRELNRAVASYQWRPVLVGGDVVNVLSNAWDDTRSRWHESMNCRVVGGSFLCPSEPTWPRTPSNTRYAVSIIAGMTPTTPSTLDNASAVYSGGVESFLRAHEDWAAAGTLTLRGAMVVAFAPVYTRNAPVLNDGAVTDPLRDWDYDQHLNDVLQLPPGVPVFDVTAIRQWTRH